MSLIASSQTELYKKLLAKLGDIVPAPELRIKSELAYEINRLKAERGAIILGHNYMEPALYHSICDIVGDSLELSRKAAETDSDPIIFCGVEFMAETAKVLNPQKTVLLPAREAGCSLAASIKAEDVYALRSKYPNAAFVTYINVYAEVKAACDVVCTSGNALQIIERLPNKQIVFLPDEYLARNIAAESGKDLIFPDMPQATKNSAKGSGLEIVAWHGKCEVHDQFTPQDVLNIRQMFPDTIILAHPECPPEVVKLCDFSGSTSKMIKFIRESNAPRFALLTECSMADNIAAEYPDKELVRLCSIRCPHMNQITLEDVLRALRENVKEITVDPAVAVGARRSLERMFELSQ